MYHAGSKVPTTFGWLAMDHEFSYSFGLRSPSYGRKSLERRHGRFGMAPMVIIQKGHLHHHQTKKVGVHKNAYL
ncbi:ATM_1a_G0053780.mRNA.1.CDS.1 [Saccharomyces cerevisiae]|nr:ATM_1a_G0053780.mRNA.1.CDS.1 [Saccharomyces cerevisiae]CAI7371962.1 ATM_1a_G0053780.mRNA.1.CDS.1 [Saccharomyces cerevisiae]